MANIKNDRTFNSLFLSRVAGKLYFDDLDLSMILDEIGTPCFIFSENQLLYQYKTLKEAFSSCLGNKFKLAFSIKSNPLPSLVQVLVNHGSYIEVTSLGEMKLALDLGINPEKLIYTNIVKSSKTITFALKSGIKYFAIDSHNDMKRIEKLSRQFKIIPMVLIRVNPLIELENTVFSCTGPYSKIGIELPEDLNASSLLISIIEYCCNSPYLQLVGIHTHLGSQITNIKAYRNGIKKIGDLFRHLLKKGIRLQILDIGGGFPVNYGLEEVPPVSVFAEVINVELEDLLAQIQIIAESGRYISAPAGILAFSVVNLKKDSLGNPIACLDGSFYNTIPDTITANWNYPIQKVIQQEEDPVIKYRFVGSTNDTLDQYHPSSTQKPSLIACKKLKEEEKIIFLQAGAYSLSFNSSYCLEKRPSVYFHPKSDMA